MEEKQMKDKWKKGEKWKPSTTSQTGVITSFEGFSKTRFFFEDKKNTNRRLYIFLLQGNKKSMRETCSPSTVIWFPLLMHVFFLTEARGGGILDYHHIRLVIYLFSLHFDFDSRQALQITYLATFGVR